MTDPLQPDEVIEPGRGLRLRRVARNAISAVPSLIRLLSGLIRDPRVPMRSKVVVGAALAYVVSPVDLIPEFVPVVGFADDLLLLSYAVNHLVQVAGEEVVLDHWDGTRDLLDLVQSVLEIAADFVPNRIRRLVNRLAG